MQYMLLIYNCERPEPGDPGFAEALAMVNAFADECCRRDAFVAGHPLQPDHSATTVSVRDGGLAESGQRRSRRVEVLAPEPK